MSSTFFTSSIMVSFSSLNICNVYFEVFVKYDIQSLSQAVSIVYFFPVHRAWIILCSFFACFFFFKKLDISDNIVWQFWVLVAPILFIVIYLFSDWLNHISEVYSLSWHSEEPLMMLFKGHALGYAHSHPEMTAGLVELSWIVSFLDHT